MIPAVGEPKNEITPGTPVSEAQAPTKESVSTTPRSNEEEKVSTKKPPKDPTTLFEPGRGKKSLSPTVDKAVGGIDLSSVEAKKKLRERSGLYFLIFVVNTVIAIITASYSLSHPMVKTVEVEKVVEKTVEKEKIIKQNEEVYRINDNTTFTIAVGGNRSTMTLAEFKDKMSAASEEQKGGEVFLVNVEGKTIQSKINSVKISDILSGEIRIKSE